jgi:hypothetical protein
MQNLKKTIKKIWPVWALILLIVRPQKFMLDYIYSIKDYLLFRDSVRPYLNFLEREDSQKVRNTKGSLLVVAGQAMNPIWLQIWGVLGRRMKAKGYRLLAISSRSNPIQNLYLRIFQFDMIYLEDLKIELTSIPPNIEADFNRLETLGDFKGYEHQGIPIGKMALSTFSRQRATGIIDIDSLEMRIAVRYWLAQIYRTLQVAKEIYSRENVIMLYFTEIFMEEYGGFYYAALKQELNIIRFAGTVRDNAIVVQHLNYDSDRTHFSSIHSQSLDQILVASDSLAMESQLNQNFLDRYSDRWALSKRNQPNTQIMTYDMARSFLGVPNEKKIGVIYSHILYDTLFFNGEDLFDSYADWLVQSVRAACYNPNVYWFIKIHPSNLWRGEVEYFHGNKYEEVRLIEEYIGELPDYVKLVYPDTPVSPYTWLQIADFGITVRGTSGIELGALGKTVVTAGTGRYENIGFTLNSDSVDQYLKLLSRIHEVPTPTPEQTKLARRFAYATFCMKPFTLDFLKPVIRHGKRKISGSDDLVFIGNFDNSITFLPESIERFTIWSENSSNIDFLNAWPN